MSQLQHKYPLLALSPRNRTAYAITSAQRTNPGKTTQTILPSTPAIIMCIPRIVLNLMHTDCKKTVPYRPNNHQQRTL